jgi:predicted alpha/beta superfamily hydrolase
VVNDITGFNKKYFDQYKENDSTPKFLLGNSLGGLISSYVAAEN